MKRIMLTAVLIIILLQLQVNAGILCHAYVPGNEIPHYKLEAISKRGASEQLLQFTLVENCYVTIRVMDSNKTQLAEGEMEKGAYNVYYKSSDGNSDRSIKCIMKIYRDQSKAELICTRKIMLQVK